MGYEYARASSEFCQDDQIVQGIIVDFDVEFESEVHFSK